MTEEQEWRRQRHRLRCVHQPCEGWAAYPLELRRILGLADQAIPSNVENKVIRLIPPNLNRLVKREDSAPETGDRIPQPERSQSQPSPAGCRVNRSGSGSPSIYVGAAYADHRQSPAHGGLPAQVQFPGLR